MTQHHWIKIVLLRGAETIFFIVRVLDDISRSPSTAKASLLFAGQRLCSSIQILHDGDDVYAHITLSLRDLVARVGAQHWRQNFVWHE